MKRYSLATHFAVVLLGCGLARSQVSCAVITREHVEVSGSDVFLADLLAPGSCAGLAASAAKMRLGAAPLAGSARILEKSTVRQMLEPAVSRLQADSGDAVVWRLAERTSIRRSGGRASCAEIAARLLSKLGLPDASSSLEQHGPSHSPSPDCGGAGRIAGGAALQVTGKTWDPVSRTLTVFARCEHPSDCVPFAVRLPHELTSAMTSEMAHQPSAPRAARAGPYSSASAGAGIGARAAAPLVRAGQKAILVWDQDGIRMVVAAVCIDAGGINEMVRVRIVASGRILEARVSGAGTVQVRS
jgi:hypothetical protein